MEDRICIDTDIIIDHLKSKGPGVKVFEEIIRSSIPVTTQINRFELLCGTTQRHEIEIINETLLGFEILSFDESSSYEASRIYVRLKEQGKLIGIRDIMIAGIAIA